MVVAGEFTPKPKAQGSKPIVLFSGMAELLQARTDFFQKELRPLDFIK